jgi:hypothetical protein
MIFKNLMLKESSKFVFVCKLWLSWIFEIHEKEIEFLKLFNLSNLDSTCHLSSDDFEILFIGYMRSLEDSNISKHENFLICGWKIVMRRRFPMPEMMSMLREEWLFIRKNSDKLAIKYKKLYLKYFLLRDLSRLPFPVLVIFKTICPQMVSEDSKFYKYLTDHIELAEWYITVLKDDFKTSVEKEFWKRYNATIKRIKE